MRILSALLVALLLVPAALAAAPCTEVLCVDVESTNTTVTFYARSRADDISVTFSTKAVNMKPQKQKFLKVVKRGRTPLMTLTALPGKRFTYEYDYVWEWGKAGAIHDDRVSYRMPYEAGTKYSLFQGPDGALSHRGKSAYDFPMKRGTPVCAARAGLVVQVVDGFGEGGADNKFRDLVNKINVLHDDGTFAEYVHLQRGSMRVKVLDRVAAGTVLALSGNSGWTTGPHLHFEVWRRMHGAPRQSLPVRFRTNGSTGVVLQTDQWYRAD